MKSFIALLIADCFITTTSTRLNVGNVNLATQPALRADLPACPCTIWRHCQRSDIFPEDGGGEFGHSGGQDGVGVACVASSDAVISMGHQVQCVPPRHRGLNYYCPPVLALKCDPGAECIHSELTTCQESDCERPDWLPKKQHAAFCAMEDCTHAECCDQGAVSITDGPDAPPEPLSSCKDLVNALAEATLARIVAYQSECHFSTGDVNFGGGVDFPNGQFQLTEPGQSKLWTYHCQHVPALQDAPDDVFADAQALHDKCPDHARLTSQLSRVGIFATAQVLDHYWKACKDAGKSTCAPLPTPTTPAPAKPVAPTEDTMSCVGTFSFTVELGVGGQQYEQTLTLHSAPEGDVEHLQCASGPLQYGSFNMKCQNGNWVLTNHGNPCYDNEKDALEALKKDSEAGGFVPIETIRLVDVTSIVTRFQLDEDSHIKCCCNSRLDPNLWKNTLTHWSWNAREHTGMCTVHDHITSCNAKDPNTHSHRITEGGQCIVNEKDRADWERILELNQPVGPRFSQPEVPTVQSKDAEDYQNCVPAHSLEQCERCTHSVQCAEGSYCCPFLKLCVESGETQCPASRMASCSNCFEQFKPNPEQCESNCENPAFPRTWLPECSSGWFFR